MEKNDVVEVEATVLEDDARKQLEAGYEEAAKILEDADRLEEFLQRFEKKLEQVPAVGGMLSKAPVLVSLVRSYVKGDYADAPVGTVVAIVSALIYFVSPFDLIPDAIPVAGYLDDAAVMAACWMAVETDVEMYQEWRKRNGK